MSRGTDSSFFFKASYWLLISNWRRSSIMNTYVGRPFLCVLWINFLRFFFFFPVCDQKGIKTPKNMVLTSEQHARHHLLVEKHNTHLLSKHKSSETNILKIYFDGTESLKG